MNQLKIFTDVPMDAELKSLFLSGLVPHEIIWGGKNEASVLPGSDSVSTLADAGVAFGQPSVTDLLHSSRLRWVQLSSAGYTRYDTPEFRETMRDRKIILTTSSSVYAEPCAEHVFAFMLAHARCLPAALKARNDFSKSSRHQLRSSSTKLRGLNVLILGFGSIARHLIRLLRPFDMKVVAVRRHPKGDEGVTIITPEALLPALATADHVVNLLPGNSDSCCFMARRQFLAMKRGAVFYNIGRGTTADQNALQEALYSGQLGAAWLDVTDPEPVATRPSPFERAELFHHTTQRSRRSGR